MAFPWQNEHTFDDGGTLSNAAFTEALASGKGDYPFYFDLVKIPNNPMPYRGGACFRVNLGASTTDVELLDPAADLEVAVDDQMVRFMFLLTSDLNMGDTNEFAIFNFKSASVLEAGVFIRFTTAGGFTVGVGKTASTADTRKPISLNVWHHIELFFAPAGSSAGIIEWRLDGLLQQTDDTITNIAPVEASWGVAGQDSGTDAGFVLFDQIAIGAEGTGGAAIYDGPPVQRYADDFEITTTQTIFVGSGSIENISLNDNGDGNAVLRAFDTDIGSLLAPRKVFLEQTAGGDVVDTATPPVKFTRGCYIQLSGTSPRAIISLCKANAYTAAGVASHAASRKPHPMGI